MKPDILILNATIPDNSIQGINTTAILKKA